ncbi:MAG TPA: hypothetical protein VJH23_00180 [archaeon]|nr:hypothetical protein [archaeon]
MEASSLIIERGMSYPISGKVLERYMRTEKTTRENAREHEREVRRYMILRALYPSARFPLANGPVDELWHTFLLFTKEYSAFCSVVADGFIHHNPGPASPTPEQIKEAKKDFADFVEKYNAVFHEAPPSELWPAIGEPGVVWSC